MRKGLMAVFVAVGLLLAVSQGSFAEDKGGKPAYDAKVFKAGKKIFKRKQCSGCHAIDTSENGEKGPGLKGIYAKKGKDWLVRWLKDPEGQLPKEPDLVELSKKYPDGMVNPELKEDQFEPLLMYLAYDGKSQGGDDKDDDDKGKGKDD